jgi:hypothetical protein
MLSIYHIHRTWENDKIPTPEALESRLLEVLKAYHRESGDFIPMLGVCAPRKNSDWPHIHLALQRYNRHVGEPLTDAEMLIMLGKLQNLKIVLSVHPLARNKMNQTDLLEYISGHMERHGARFLPGQGVRTNFEEDIPED